MRVPNEQHIARPLRIHEVAEGFRLEDVWRLPAEGGREDFRRLVQIATTADIAQASNKVVRALFDIRWKLGARLGWDGEDDGVGQRVASLRDRLPADLLVTDVPSFKALPFTALYLTDDEFAAETANRTMHGMLHLSWVPDDQAEGGFHGEMAVYVKPNGLLGQAYMAAIKPFRYLLVYPALMRQFERRWQEAAAQPA